MLFVLRRFTGCSAQISQNSTHIQNPGFSAAYTDTTSCEYTLIKVSTDICQFRLDFVNFVTTGPDVNTSPFTQCSDDKVRRGGKWEICNRSKMR